MPEPRDRDLNNKGALIVMAGLAAEMRRIFRSSGDDLHEIGHLIYEPVPGGGEVGESVWRDQSMIACKVRPGTPGTRNWVDCRILLPCIQ